MKLLNRKGFTLIELLAVLVILGLLVALAVPNVTGVVRRQRNSTYVEDAKRLVTRLKTTFAKNPDLKVTGSCFSLRFLDNGDFDQGPNNGYYLKDFSYVRYTDGVYYVTIIECVTCNSQKAANDIRSSTLNSNDIRGVKLTTYASLTTSKPEDLVVADGLNTINFNSDFEPSAGKPANCSKVYFDPDKLPR